MKNRMEDLYLCRCSPEKRRIEEIWKIGMLENWNLEYCENSHLRTYDLRLTTINQT